MTKKELRKKRQRMRIAAAAVLVLAMIVSVFGFFLYKNHRTQQQYKETVAAQKDLISTRRAQVESAQRPFDESTQTGMDEGLFSSMKQQALNALNVDVWTALENEKTLTVEQIDQALDTQGNEQDQQCLYLMENIQDYTPEILEFYMNDPDRFEFVKAWPQRGAYQSAPDTLEESLESVPHLLQWDLRWGYLPYGDALLYFNGCAPTSLAMVFSYLKQDPSITPAKLKDYAQAYGYYVDGAGTSHEFLSAAAGEYGIQVEGIEPTREAVSQALGEGKVLVFNMLPGNFTRTGHFIVVTGEENGQLKVKDPNSISRTNRTWSYEEVLPETATVWAYSV